jgi:4-hydroxythreonine-4-phosphate dehydrogenase
MSRSCALTPVVAITVGDPAGIGPEVVAKALADPGVSSLAEWIIVGDTPVWNSIEVVTGAAFPRLKNAQLLEVHQLDAKKLTVGKVNAAYGRAALEYVRVATRLCLEGKADAMVTAPVSKEAIALITKGFSGHTEFIARLCRAPEPRMLLVSDRLRVVHVSTHVSLRKACDLDTRRVRRTIQLGHAALQELGLDRPRVAVCGLNPHAGENRLFGDEDADFILPAVKSARRAGILCAGPLPADTIFLSALRREYDLVVAMYHDQGHIPMKLLDFDRAVNVSLGLPIIRTSVDHGTAFDIAGQNQANPASMMSALRLAAQMAAHRRSQKTSFS